MGGLAERPAVLDAPRYRALGKHRPHTPSQPLRASPRMYAPVNGYKLNSPTVSHTSGHPYAEASVCRMCLVCCCFSQVVHGLSDIGRSADGLNQAYLTFAMHNHPGTKTTEFLTKHTHLQKVLLSNNRVQVCVRPVV